MFLEISWKFKELQFFFKAITKSYENQAYLPQATLQFYPKTQLEKASGSHSCNYQGTQKPGLEHQDSTVSAVVWLVAQEVANAGSLDNSASCVENDSSAICSRVHQKKKSWMSFEPLYNLLPSQSRICMVKQEQILKISSSFWYAV